MTVLSPVLNKKLSQIVWCVFKQNLILLKLEIAAILTSNSLLSIFGCRELYLVTTDKMEYQKRYSTYRGLMRAFSNYQIQNSFYSDIQIKTTNCANIFRRKTSNKLPVKRRSETPGVCFNIYVYK